MKTYSKLLFDRGIIAKLGRPNMNDLLFINTSFFNFFLPLLLIGLMRWIPQANHLVFGQLEGQDPIYSTLLIGLATLFTMMIYTRQTYFYEDHVDQSSMFKIVNQIAFLLPLGVWMLAITFNYPAVHWRSILICTVLLILAGTAMSRTKYNIFREIIKERQINKLILVCMALIIMIFVFFLIKFDEIEGKDHLTTWTMIFIISVFLITVVINEFARRKVQHTSFDRSAIFWNSAANATYIFLILLLVIWIFGNYNKFGNAFDVIILYFLFLRMLLFGIGVLARYLANSKPIHFMNIKFVTILVGCYFIGIITKPGKGRDQYSLQVMSKPHVRISFNEYMDRWLIKKDSTAPIYLIAGQGGGSRAGCAFFTTMTLLDSMIDKNTMAITTISGSSNGAGFYLGIKKALPTSQTYYQLIPPEDTLRIKKIDSMLYQKDYISNSLFKLLFTDYARTILGSNQNTKSRNLSLIQEELASYHLVKHYLKLSDITLLDSAWSSIYTNEPDVATPLFLPLSYNIEYGVKAIHSPVRLPIEGMHPYFSTLDSMGDDRDVQINKSILTSQMFPIISASGSIDSFHYLDGGVYDNLAYETLFDLYHLVEKKRDIAAPRRSIILLSIINGNYEADLKFDQIRTEFDAVGGALSQSMFSNNPIVHKTEGLLKLKDKDKFFELKIFKPNEAETQPSFGKKIFQRFQYVPQKDKVILSRYLTMNDISNNIMYSAYKEVDSLKVNLNKFLSRKN